MIMLQTWSLEFDHFFIFFPYPLQAVGTVLLICVEVLGSLQIWQDFVKMRLGLRHRQSMHVGSFSPGRAGEKLGIRKVSEKSQ